MGRELIPNELNKGCFFEKSIACSPQFSLVYCQFVNILEKSVKKACFKNPTR